MHAIDDSRVKKTMHHIKGLFRLSSMKLLRKKFRNGYSAFQNIASVISDINDVKVDIFYNNDNLTSPIFCKYSIIIHCKVKDTTCIDTGVICSSIFFI